MEAPKTYDDKGNLSFEYILYRVKNAASLDEMLYWRQIGTDHLSSNVKPIQA